MRETHEHHLATVLEHPEQYWTALPDGCWQWIRDKTHDGYGRWTRKIDGKRKYAHVVMWEAENGLKPEDHDVHHICRNTSCVNPAHLESVTHRENLLLGIGWAAVNASRTHCPHGHPYSGENLYVSKGGRWCRACKRDYDRKYGAAYMRKWRAAKRAAEAV